MKDYKWVVCRHGKGIQIINGIVDKYETNFDIDSVGLIESAKVVADHDHHTGNIRDFICDSCNTGLGRFKNGENYLMNAVNYIKDRDTLKHR